MLTPFQVRARRALAENPFFRDLSDECLRAVSRRAVRRGDVLFEKGAAADDLYALVGGQLKLFSASPHGGQISFGLVAPGELVGQTDMSEEATRPASAMALAHSEVARIARRDLDHLLARCPELRAALWEASTQIARRLTERIEDAAFLSIEARIEKALVDVARRFGERIEAGTLIHLRQQDLADVLGLSRESVSKVLVSRAQSGQLELGRGRIVLLGV